MKTSSRRLRFFVFFYLYTLQGVPAGFALTAIANYLIAQHVPASGIGMFGAVIGLPWMLQFIWGPVIDKYKYYFGNSQQKWVTLTQCFALAASLLLLLIKDPVKDMQLMAAFFCIHSLFACIQDASVDTLAIHVTPVNERGSVNAYMRGGFLAGIAFGAAVLSTALHRYGFFTTAIIQSCLLATGILLTIFVKIETSDEQTAMAHKMYSIKTLFQKLLQGFVKKRSIYMILFLVLVYACFSVFGRSFTYYIISVLHLPDNDLSVMQGTWGSAITFLVVIAGGKIADKVGHTRFMKMVLAGAALFTIAISIVTFFIPVQRIAVTGIILWNFADPLLSVCAFPLLMGLCRQPVEGSQFTAYMACINFADVLGSYASGSIMMVFSPLLLALSAGIVLLLLVLLIYKAHAWQRQSLLVPHQ